MSGRLFYPRVRARPTSQVLGTFSPEALGGMELLTGASIASAVWPAANLAIAYGFVLTEPRTVLTMWSANGATVNGNIDLGIYDSTWTKLVAMGATAHATTSDLQKLDISDTLLQAGVQYYAALHCTSGTATFQRATKAAAFQNTNLYQYATGAGALPTTFVPAAPTNDYAPWFGLSFVSTY